MRPDYLEPTDDFSELKTFARSLAFETDRTAMRATIASHLGALSDASVVWFERVNGGRFFVRADSRSASANDQDGFDAEGPLVRWLRVNHRALVLKTSKWASDFLDSDEQALLRSLNASVCLPVASGKQLFAVLILSGHGPTWEPATGDADRLLRHADYAAVSWEALAAREKERQDLEANARAQQLVVTGQLAASVAHEIRNPLTAIRSSVQLMLDPAVSRDEQHQLLTQMLEEVDRIDGTISGLTNLSRSQELELTDADFADMVDASLTFMQPYFKQHKISLIKHFNHGPYPVRADSGQLRQVFLNVLLNACQATPPGGTVVVSAEERTETQEGGQITCAAIVIRDTGRGMSPQELERAFDPFFTTRQSGTGLGLPVSLDIMARHGGGIRLQSETGLGTTVTLILPMRGM